MHGAGQLKVTAHSMACLLQVQPISQIMYVGGGNERSDFHIEEGEVGERARVVFTLI